VVWAGSFIQGFNLITYMYIQSLLAFTVKLFRQFKIINLTLAITNIRGTPSPRNNVWIFCTEIIFMKIMGKM
jgi:hypothetical protein